MILQRIEPIIQNVHLLSARCYPDFTFKIEYLTIFSQSPEDFESLQSELRKLGEESSANNGFKFKLNTPINYGNEIIDLVRIRMPDVHRKELGCVDLTYDKNKYKQLKEIALEKGFDVILRKGYEMIELSDFEINVYAYLVKEN